MRCLVGVLEADLEKLAVEEEGEASMDGIGMAGGWMIRRVEKRCAFDVVRWV